MKRKRFTEEQIHARAEISIWRDDYNNIRPHSALANLAPAQYAQTLTKKGCSTVQ